MITIPSFSSSLARLAVVCALVFAWLLGSMASVAAASPSPSPSPSSSPATSWCLTVKKVASGTDKVLSGAVFELRDPAGQIASQTSGADGFAVFCGLAAGTYNVVETKAPAGYLRDQTTHQVPINDQVCQNSDCATLTISDQAPSTDAGDPSSNGDQSGLFVFAMLAGLGLLYLAYVAAGRLGLLESHRS